jgi:hypothetical protein
MLYLQGKFMKATELAARGDYPPSYLVTVFDEEKADTLNLICDVLLLPLLCQVGCAICGLSANAGHDGWR